MPLIRAIGRWIGRRNEVTEPYVPAQPTSGGDQGMAWTLVVLVASPILAFLVLTGLAYEGVIRVDRKRSARFSIGASRSSSPRHQPAS